MHNELIISRFLLIRTYFFCTFLLFIDIAFMNSININRNTLDTCIILSLINLKIIKSIFECEYTLHLINGAVIVW